MQVACRLPLREADCLRGPPSLGPRTITATRWKPKGNIAKSRIDCLAFSPLEVNGLRQRTGPYPVCADSTPKKCGVACPHMRTLVFAADHR